ncbi:MAG: 4'-phosphopantetheinyl transferase superfamily protein [Chloroflexi bacterium]|nr:4'-phosphopantetheinyl transferase superfamily protein [Chloroflexota bacterium]
MKNIPASWPSPPQNLTLGAEEVHVWRVELNQSAQCVEALRRTLAEDELKRAERFYFDSDRQHFIVARGALRTILGRHLGAQPDQLRFVYSSHGKPALVGDCGFDAIHFNVAHSYGIALVGVTRVSEIGIDVEYVRREVEHLSIARRFFSSGEVAALYALPADLRQEAFFTCWTRKEAFIKARGEGLSYPLDQFDVSLAPDEPAALLSVRGCSTARGWSLRSLSPGPGYAAALALEGEACRLACWQWSAYLMHNNP